MVSATSVTEIYMPETKDIQRNSLQRSCSNAMLRKEVSLGLRLCISERLPGVVGAVVLATQSELQGIRKLGQSGSEGRVC